MNLYEEGREDENLQGRQESSEGTKVWRKRRNIHKEGRKERENIKTNLWKEGQKEGASKKKRREG